MANQSLKASTITVGGGSSGSLELASSKSITGNVALDNGARLILNSGSSVVGAIDGVANNNGTLEIAGSSVSISSTIGATHSLNQVIVDGGAGLTLGSDLSATDVSVAGTLDFGSSNHTVSGNLTGVGGSQFNLNDGAHVVTGAFTMAASDILQLDVLSSLSAGSITVGGVATVSSSSYLSLTIDVGANLTAGAIYTILSGGAGSSLSQISSSHINVNGTGSNHFGSLMFATSVIGNNLILRVANIVMGDIVINTETTYAQNLDQEGQSLTVTTGGNLVVDTSVYGPAVNVVDNPNTAIEVNTGNSATGIIATGATSGAIFETGANAQVANIAVTSGIITSDSASEATIALNGGVGTTTEISTSTTGTISNTATAGSAIAVNRSANSDLIITNNGSILVNNNASSTAIQMNDSDGGSSLEVSNTGTISAGSSGVAIEMLGSSNSLTLSNIAGGSIIGEIIVGANSASITNNSSGGITGAISATTGNLDITNTYGTITGNITLGSNSSSSVTLNGGSIVGNLLMNNSSQIITFNGGNLNGTINGSGNVVVAASTIANGDIGGISSITSLTVRANQTFNIATNNNLLSATNVYLENNAILRVGSASVYGTIQGSSAGNGIVRFAENNTIQGSVGTSTARVAAIEILDGAEVNAQNNNLYAAAINLSNSASLTIGSGNLYGALNGTSNGRGSITFNASRTLDSSSVSFGATYALSAININDGVTITANESLSATTLTIGNGASGALTLSSGNSINGSVIINNGANLNLNNSSVTGTINGAGSLNITGGTVTTQSAIGNSTALSSITIASGATLNTATNNNAISATNINVAGTLTLGTAAVNATIQGLTSGSGTVRYTANTSLAGDVGTADHLIDAVQIVNGATVSVGSHNINSNSVSLSDNSTLAISSGAVASEITGSGTVSFSQSYNLSTNSTNLGSATTNLSNVLVSGGTLTVSTSNIYADTVSLGTSGTMNLGALSNGIVYGAIQGENDNSGTLNITQNYTAHGNIGASSNSLATVFVTAGKTLNMSTYNIDAQAITLANNATLSLNSGTLTGAVNGSSSGLGKVKFNSNNSIASGVSIGATRAVAEVDLIGAVSLAVSGSINANAVNLDLGSTLTINSGGSVTGAIQGSSNNYGTVVFAANTDLTGDVGVYGNALAEINLSADKILNVGSNNLYANSIVLNNNSNLTLDGGTLNGIVQGASNNTGKITFLQSYNLSDNIGTNSRALSAVEVAASQNLTLGDKNIYAQNVILNNESLLILSDTTAKVYGNVIGSSSAVGNVNITQDYSSQGNFGAAGSELNRITVSNNKNFTVGSHAIYASTVALGSNATLTLFSDSSINASVQGTNDNNGSVIFTENFTANSDFGTAAHSLNSISINDGATLTLSSHNIDATTISIGDNSTLSLTSGSITGTVQGVSSGKGTLSFLDSRTLDFNVGTSISKINNLTIASGKTLDSGSTDIYTNNIIIENSATFRIGSGHIEGVIQGASDGVGNLTFTQDFIAVSDIGLSSKKLANVSVATGKTLDLDTGDVNVYANSFSLEDSANLLIGSSVINAPIDGANAGQGRVTFKNTMTTTAAIGATKALEAITISNTATITLGANISATTITVGGDTGGHIIANGKNISATSIVLASAAVLDIDFAAVVTGAINGKNTGTGEVNFSGTGDKIFAASIGASRKISQITIANTLNLSISNDFAASTITVNGNLTHNGGNLGDATSIIAIADGSKISHLGGAIRGVVEGASDGVGTLEVGADYTTTASVGASGNSLRNLNILSGATLNLNGDVYANNVAVSGTLAFGSDSRVVNGNVSVNSSATIDAGSASNRINGTLDIANNATLGVTIAGPTTAGSIVSTGIATIGNNLTLAVTIDSSLDSVINSGTKYTILSGAAGSSIAPVSTSNINVNNLGSNRYGHLSFSSNIVGSDLILTITKTSNSSFGPNARAVYNTLNNIGDSAQGELRALQNFVNSTSSDAKAAAALDAATPQVDNSINRSAFDTSNAAISAVESRMGFGNEIGVSAGDDSQGNDLWIKVLNTSARQSNLKTGGFGYNSSAYGFAIGGDNLSKEDTMKGFSLNYISSQITSASKTKLNNVNSYQLNLYRGANYGDYFLDGIVGLAVNKYDSSRSIAEVGVSAKAKYTGKTYVAKLNGGRTFTLENGLKLIPNASLTLARNQINSYSESGAGTLNLSVKNSPTNFFEARIGINTSYDFILDDFTRVSPQFKISYGHDFVGAKQSTTSNFVNQAQSFSSQGSKVYTNSIIIGTGLNIYRNEQTEVDVEYTIERKANYHASTGSFKIKYNF